MVSTVVRGLSAARGGPARGCHARAHPHARARCVGPGGGEEASGKAKAKGHERLVSLSGVEDGRYADVDLESLRMAISASRDFDEGGEGATEPIGGEAHGFRA